MNELVLATNNLHKVREITDILKALPVKTISLAELKRVPEVVEDGDTLEENAVKKARTIARRFRKWALADDTGLMVDALDGEPGVYSARWAGPGCTYEDNNKKLLEKLRGLPRKKRGASFRCVIALSSPAGRTWTVEGEIRGVIAEKAKGRRGFGYDPLFYVPRYRKTFAELSENVKNRVSHRARALRKARILIREHLEK
ncbi:MAG: XTP/dITP diphosphatase [Endomicrobiales bacterium]